MKPQRWTIRKPCIRKDLKGRAFSRKAAKECSPRRKPWVENAKSQAPEGAKEKLLR
jgi:hypothetical protein